jgi:hypothetical protein
VSRGQCSRDMELALTFLPETWPPRNSALTLPEQQRYTSSIFILEEIKLI